jgi:hypothetical protein
MLNYRSMAAAILALVWRRSRAATFKKQTFVHKIRLVQIGFA